MNAFAYGEPRLPRGIPAASLKLPASQSAIDNSSESSAGNTRGLIEALAASCAISRVTRSSAGNTRGLIEAE